MKELTKQLYQGQDLTFEEMQLVAETIFNGQLSEAQVGALLIALDNATLTVFGDDAFITHIIPSPRYKDDGTILDITISIIGIVGFCEM